MGFAAFADAPVEAGIVEVGLGGSWDATNVLDAQVAGRHPSRLRPHGAAAARRWKTSRREKAGIMPADATAVLAQQDPTAGAGPAAPRRRGRRDGGARRTRVRRAGTGAVARRRPDGCPCRAWRRATTRCSCRCTASTWLTTPLVPSPRWRPFSAPQRGPLDDALRAGGFAHGGLARAAGGGAPLADDPGGRGPQSGRGAGARRRDRGGVRVQLAGRGGRRARATRTRRACSPLSSRLPAHVRDRPRTPRRAACRRASSPRPSAAVAGQDRLQVRPALAGRPRRRSRPRHESRTGRRRAGHRLPS